MDPSRDIIEKTADRVPSSGKKAGKSRRWVDDEALRKGDGKSQAQRAGGGDRLVEVRAEQRDLRNSVTALGVGGFIGGVERLAPGLVVGLIQAIIDLPFG